MTFDLSPFSSVRLLPKRAPSSLKFSSLISKTPRLISSSPQISVIGPSTLLLQNSADKVGGHDSAVHLTTRIHRLLPTPSLLFPSTSNPLHSNLPSWSRSFQIPSLRRILLFGRVSSIWITRVWTFYENLVDLGLLRSGKRTWLGPR